MYEIIRTFSPIFRGLKFENPRTAAIYYVNLIINFPTNLQIILKEAQSIYGTEVNRQALQAGKRGAVKEGFNRQDYFTEDADVDFDREMYLPVNPEIIWEETQDTIKTYWKQPEEMAFRKTKVKELYEHYLRNFKKYGLGIEKGSVTGLFNSYWMWRGGVNILKYNYTKRIDIMLNNLEFFMIPDYFEYYEKELEQGMAERVLYDLNYKTQAAKRRGIRNQRIWPCNGTKA